MKLSVIHGPNLNLLGERETSVYGTLTLDEINAQIRKRAEKQGLEVEFFQFNSEAQIIDAIHKLENGSGLIINAGAYTHTSIAIRDAISAKKVTAVEVHLSNIYAREEFRHTSLIAPVCKGQISGFGHHSYLLAVDALAALNADAPPKTAK